MANDVLSVSAHDGLSNYAINVANVLMSGSTQEGLLYYDVNVATALSSFCIKTFFISLMNIVN